MRVTVMFLAMLCASSCVPVWQEPPYEVYYIDGKKTLGYSLGQGAFIGRVDEPKSISSNAKYLSVYACAEQFCSYFYIDKVNDHQFAERNEFVFGPYTQAQFASLTFKLGLPPLVL